MVHTFLVIVLDLFFKLSDFNDLIMVALTKVSFANTAFLCRDQ